MHLDDVNIQRLLDRELDSREEAVAHAHLRDCVLCSERRDDLEGDRVEITSLLASLDQPLRRIDPAAILARAESSRRIRDRFSLLRRAAAVILAIGVAGVVYALPGSPVRAWVRDAIRTISAKPRRVEPPPQPSGISIVPEDHLEILFRLGAARGEGMALLSLTDGAEVRVQAPGRAATFASRPGLLEIEVRDASAPFLVQIPRSAPWVEIQADGVALFRKEGARITTRGRPDSRGGYALDIGRHEPER